MSFKIEKATEKLKKGIIELQKPQPFFAHLLMRMQLEEMPEGTPMPTVGVDQFGTLYYDEEWVMKLPDNVVAGLMCHEVLHVALLHMARTGDRNHEIANVAQDVVVNSICLSSGLALPEGGVPIDTYRDESAFPLNGAMIRITDVSKKAWETVYDDIMHQLKQQGKQPQSSQGQGQGSGKGQGDGMQGRSDGMGWDNHNRSGKQKSQQQKDMNAQEWQGNIAQAAQYAKQQGKLPSGMKRLIDQILKPKVAWKGMLMKYLRPYVIPVDWSYQRPHKKSRVLDVFLPSTLKEHTEVEVIVDTSGSISKAELTEFLSEIIAIAKSMTHITVHVTFVDAKVHTRYVVDNGDIPKILAMEAKGGGGTDMEAGLDYIKQHNSQVPVAIVFTDGYTNFERRKMDYPFDVLWVINKTGIGASHMKKIPYGIKIKMD